MSSASEQPVMFILVKDALLTFRLTRFRLSEPVRSASNESLEEDRSTGFSADRFNWETDNKSAVIAPTPRPRLILHARTHFRYSASRRRRSSGDERVAARDAMGPRRPSGDQDDACKLPMTNDTFQRFHVAKTFHEHASAINSMCFADNGDYLVTSSEDDQIVLYDAQRCMIKKTIFSKKYGADLVMFTHDVKTAIHASNKNDHTIRMLLLTENRYLRYFEGHQGKLTSLRMSPKQDMFVSASEDKTVRLWDTRSTNSQGILSLPCVPAVDFDPEGLAIVIAGDNRRLYMHDIRTIDRPPFSTFNYEEKITGDWTGVKFSPNGRYVMIMTTTMIGVVDAYDGRLLCNFNEHRANVNSNLAAEACFSPSSGHIFSGSPDGYLYIWNVREDSCIAKLSAAGTSPITTMKFCPTAMLLASSYTATRAGFSVSFRNLSGLKGIWVSSSWSSVRASGGKFSVAMERLGLEFYAQNCEDVARGLLGKVLVRKLPDGDLLRGVIVETEGYLGIHDRCSHSYGSKKTDRTKPMFMAPGTTYVYHIYGKYFCFNISSGGDGAAVLIRAVEPVAGFSFMRSMRFNSLKPLPGKFRKELKQAKLCDGPSKLCCSYAFTKKEFNAVDLSVSESVWIEPGDDVPKEKIVTCKRIGVESYGYEWSSKPLRFYIHGNPAVSNKEKDEVPKDKSVRKDVRKRPVKAVAKAEEMTETEKRQEKQIEKEQLQEIYRLMKSEDEKFGKISMSDVVFPSCDIERSTSYSRMKSLFATVVIFVGFLSFFDHANAINCMNCWGKESCEKPQTTECAKVISRCLTVFLDKNMEDLKYKGCAPPGSSDSLGCDEMLGSSADFLEKVFNTKVPRGYQCTCTGDYCNGAARAGGLSASALIALLAVNGFVAFRYIF
ncbi:unnamed protein product [Notodromas monacha]|uniref:DNA-3-methyladenine glycosylase n=1 Tax=Notodromas monacha TaxID=399045 RepID=A0A7R9BP60_9CRUS|nr:unnamed protein product [Notodromas monacha]CAG0917747.1 unnamed protein product [Notodromas monacha]